MTHRVLLTADAARDLEALHEYVSTHDSPAAAEHLLANIETVIGRLSELPDRRSRPRELLALGIRGYRELLFEP